MPKREPQGGYHIFTAVGQEERGFEGVAVSLQEQINRAMEIHEITFLSGPIFREDPASRGVYFAAQGATLKRKTE
jgi:hypothetical protein